MANHLRPPEGREYLSPKEVVRRAKLAFEYVDASSERGSEMVGDKIVALLRMKSGGHIQVDDSYITHIEEVRGQALAIYLAHDQFSEHQFLDTTIVPDEPILIGFSSRQHEDSSKELVVCFAAALEYEIINL